MKKGWWPSPVLASTLKRSYGATSRLDGLALCGLTEKTADRGGSSTTQRIIQQKPPRPLTEKQAHADQRDYVFLDNLAQRTQDPKILRDQILSALLGGRDTTSSLLSNLFHTLQRRPVLWRQLREEAISLGAEPLTQDRLKKASLAYLRGSASKNVSILYLDAPSDHQSSEPPCLSQALCRSKPSPSFANL